MRYKYNDKNYYSKEDAINAALEIALVTGKSQEVIVEDFDFKEYRELNPATREFLISILNKSYNRDTLSQDLEKIFQSSFKWYDTDYYIEVRPDGSHFTYSNLPF